MRDPRAAAFRGGHDHRRAGVVDRARHRLRRGAAERQAHRVEPAAACGCAAAASSPSPRRCCARRRSRRSARSGRAARPHRRVAVTRPVARSSNDTRLACATSARRPWSNSASAAASSSSGRRCAMRAWLSIKVSVLPTAANTCAAALQASCDGAASSVVRALTRARSTIDEHHLGIARHGQAVRRREQQRARRADGHARCFLHRRGIDQRHLAAPFEPDPDARCVVAHQTRRLAAGFELHQPTQAPRVGVDDRHAHRPRAG